MSCDCEVLICQYVNCVANGSPAVLAAFQAHFLPHVKVTGCPCQGQCNMGVTVRVLPDETWYAQVKPEDVPEIVEQHFNQDKPVERLLHPRFYPRYSF